MSRLLLLTALASALSAGAATLDFVRFLVGPGTLETPWGTGSLARPTAVASGPDGSTYVVGRVDSPTLPVTAGVVQPDWIGGSCLSGTGLFGGLLQRPCGDAFVARIAGDGSVIFATYLGGLGEDSAVDIAVDAEGHAYVAGFAGSGFPFLEGSGQFVLKLSRAGTRVLWASTSAGGIELALAPDGGVVVAGRGPQEPTPLGAPEAAPVFRSDNGQVWKPVNRGLPPRSVSDFTAGPGGLLFAVAGGLFRSDDSGDTWREIPLGLVEDAFRSDTPSSVAIQPENPSVVLAGTGQGVVRSEDGGGTWANSSAGLPAEIRVRRLVFAPSDRSRVYLAGPRQALFRSSAAGVSWTRMSVPRSANLGSFEARALVVDPFQADTLYVSLQGVLEETRPDGGTSKTGPAFAVLRSDDAGNTWVLLRSSLDSIGPLAVDPSDSGTVYLGTHLGLEVSSDRGLTWGVSNPVEFDVGRRKETAVTALATDPSDGTVFAASASGVFWTVDQGRTWERLPARPARSFALLAVAPDQPGRLFATLGVTSRGQAVISKLSSDGTSLEWSVSFGGAGADSVSDLAVAGDGSVWFTGTTESLDFPLVNPLQAVYPGGQTTAFLGRLQPDGSALAFTTFLGGGKDDQGLSLALEPLGAVVATGTTWSNDFPTVLAEQESLAGGSDAYLVRLRQDASGYDFATYVGGPDNDRGRAITVDSNNRLILAGETEPADSGGSAAVPDNSTRRDLFVARFDRSGRSERRLRLGGDGRDSFSGLAVDAAGRVLLGAITTSSHFGIIFDPASFGSPVDPGLVAALDLDREVVVPELTSVENGAGFFEGPIAPGEMLTLRGRVLGPESGAGYQAGSDGSIAPELAGTQVWIADRRATPLYVQAGQINVLAPFDLEPGSIVEIVVVNATGRSEPARRSVAEAAPALYTLDSTGEGPVAALDEQLRVISSANPALRGSVVALFATGLGQVEPAPAEGRVIPNVLPTPVPLLRVRVEFLGTLQATTVDPEWIGAAPTLPAGIVQINVRVPSTPEPSGKVTIRLRVDGFRFRQRVTLAVR